MSNAVIPADILIFDNKVVNHVGIAVHSDYSRYMNARREREISADSLLHANGADDGVVKDDILANSPGKAFVYRCPSLDHFARAAISETARKIVDRGAKYGVSRTLFRSWTSTSSFGSGAISRLLKYSTRFNDAKAGAIVKNVYCSEFVVLAVQLGLQGRHNSKSTFIRNTVTLQMNDKSVDDARGKTGWIDLDGKHATPHALRNWLEGETGAKAGWLKLGTFENGVLAVTASLDDHQLMSFDPFEEEPVVTRSRS